MSSSKIKLYAFALSPFVHKAAAMLDFKKLAYETIFIHPQKKAEISFSRRGAVPILDDGGTIVEDSTEIALYLDANYPEPFLIPDDRADRATVFKLDLWLDEEFYGRYYAARIFGIPANRERSLQSFLDTATFSKLEARFLPKLAPFLLREMIAKAQLEVAHSADMLDQLEAHLGRGPFLGELAAPSMADLSAFGVLSVLTDLNFEGAEQLRERTALHEWMERVRPLTSGGDRIYKG